MTGKILELCEIEVKENVLSLNDTLLKRPFCPNCLRQKIEILRASLDCYAVALVKCKEIANLRGLQCDLFKPEKTDTETGMPDQEASRKAS